MNKLTWIYSHPQLEAARRRVAAEGVRANEWPPLPTAAASTNAIVTEFGMLALAYEELLADWEASELNTESKP